MIYLAPFITNQSIAASTISAFFSNQLTFPFYVSTVRVAFALNTQRLLQVRCVVTDSASFASVIPPPIRHVPGIPLFAPQGGQDFIVGDGQEGEIVVPIHRSFPRGFRISVEGWNLDAGAAHTLDTRVDIADLTQEK